MNEEATAKEDADLIREIFAIHFETIISRILVDYEDDEEHHRVAGN